MAKKKKITVPPSLLKFGIVVLLAVVIGLSVCNWAADVFLRSRYFSVKSVVIDPSLQFVNQKDLVGLIGKNIFSIDLRRVQQNIGMKYPEVTQMKINRRFPDQIFIAAKRRVALAQVKMRGRTLTLDEKGVVLSTGSKADAKLPMIVGAREGGTTIILGLPLEGEDTRYALRIITAFKEANHLASQEIDSVDVGNLSKINVMLANQIEIILDRDHIEHKIKVLDVLLSQSSIDFNTVKYVDLRFKEPILGKK